VAFKFNTNHFRFCDAVEDKAATPFEDEVAGPAKVAQKKISQLSNHKEKVWMSTMVLNLR
jgi:hypothetical protein